MKMTMRRGVSLLLAVLMMMTVIFGTTVSAVETNSSTASDDRLYRGTFRFSGHDETFYYSDSFFDDPDEHLRTLSAAAAFSLEGTDSTNTLSLMTDIGMDASSIAIDGMSQGTRDSIGTFIAHKYINGRPLVALVIRGSGYSSEWASNVRVGTDGDAAGFSEAASTVSDRLRSYLITHHLDNARIWVTGYSRGGGAADLIGKMLNEAPEDYSTSSEGIYVYTFEAPRVSADDTVYRNIHNINNINDIVPRMYPTAWGLHLNGVSESIGTVDETVTSKYFSVLSPGFIKDYQEEPISAFLSGFESFVGESVTREYYSANTEQYVSDVCDLYFGKSDRDQEALKSYFNSVKQNYLSRSDVVPVFLKLMLGPSADGNSAKISTMLTESMDTVRSQLAPPLTDAEYSRLKKAVTPMVDLGLKMADHDIYYSESGEGGLGNYKMFYRFVTFMENISTFFYPHYNTVIWDEMKAADSYYTEGVDITPGSIEYAGHRYTYSALGEALFEKAAALGFNENDIEYLRNGYDLRMDTTAVEIQSPDPSMIRTAESVVGDDMEIFSFYQVTATKTVGFRVGKAISDEDDSLCAVSLTLMQSPGERYDRFEVIRVDDTGAAPVDSLSIGAAFGGVSLEFSGSVPAVYAVAYDPAHKMILGDVDKDAAITRTDVSDILGYLSDQYSFGEDQLRTGDIDGDGAVTILDATMAQCRLAVMSAPYDIGGLIE